MADVSSMLAKFEADIQPFAQSVAKMDTIMASSDRSMAQLAQSINSQMNNIGKSAQTSAAVFSKAMSSLSPEVSKLLQDMDPLAAKMSEIQRVQNAVNSAFRQGMLTDQQYADATAHLTKQHQNLTNAQTKMTSSSKLSAFQLQNLGYQVNDIITSLASGIPIEQVLAQQGGQVVQAFGSIDTAAEYLVNPFTLMAALAASGAVAYASYKSSVDALDKSLRASSGTVGLTTGQLEQIAEAASQAGAVTTREARSIEESLLSIGTVGTRNFQPLLDASAKMTKAMGDDAPDAIKTVAQAMADPARAAQDLNTKYWNLTAAQERQIEAMQRAGNIEGAQGVLIDAIAAKMSNAEKQTSLWAKTISVLSNLFDNLGKKIAGPQTTIEKLARAQQNLKIAQGSASGWGGSADDIARIQAEIDKYQQLLRTEQAVAEQEAQRKAAQVDISKANTVSDSITPGDSEIKALQTQQGELRNGLTSALFSGDTASATKFADALNQVNGALKTYRTDGQKAVEMAQAQAAAAGMGTEAAQRYLAQKKVEIDQEGKAIDGAEAERQKKAALLEVDGTLAAQKVKLATEMQAEIDASNAVAAAFGKSSEAGYAEQLVQEARVNAIKNGTSFEYEYAKAIQARRQQTAAAIAQGAEELAQMERQAAQGQKLIDAAGISPYAFQAAQTEIGIQNEYQPKIANANASGDTAGAGKLQQEMQEKLSLAQQQQQQAAQASMAADNAAQQQNIALLGKRIELLGQSGDKADEELAAYQAELDLKQQNIALDSEIGQDHIAEMVKVAQLNKQLQEQQAIVNEISSTFDSMSTSVGNAFAEMATDGKSAFDALGDAATSVLNDIYNEMWKLAVTNPLKNALGLNGGTTLPDVSTVLTKLSSLLGFAGGTDGAPPGMAWVGENGPELVSFKGGEQVYPAHVSAAMAAASKIPGYANGIYSLPKIASPTAANSNVVNNISVTNNAGSDVSTKSSQNSSGGVDLEIMVDKAVSKKIATRGSASNRAIRTTFGASEKLIGR